MKWTNEQRTIIEAPVENACVIACAGAGKTAVIVERLTRLIKAQTFAVNDVAVITFTNKAADELAYRLQRSLEAADIKGAVWTSTIHSFCLRYLKLHDPLLSEELKVLTEGKQYALLSRHYRDWHLDTLPLVKQGEAERLSILVKTLDLVTLDQVDLADWNDEYPELCAFIRTYHQWLTDNGYVDYSGILERMNTALDDKAFQGILFSQLKYLIIDEYQDTDPLQAQIVAKISKHIRVMVVGDDDQCIYQFRGTDVTNIIRFAEQVEQAKQYFLLKNFRCRENILAVGKHVASGIGTRIRKKMLSVTDGGNVIARHFASVDEEATYVADQIELLQSRSAVGSYSDVAILFRSVASAHEPFITELEARDIPYRIIGDKSFMEQPVVERMLRIFQFINEEAITENSFARLSGYFECVPTPPGKGTRDYEAMSDTQLRRLGFSDIGILRFRGLLAIREVFRAQRFGSMLELYHLVLEQQPEFLEGDDLAAMSNLAKLSQIIQEYDEVADSKRLSGFITYLLTSGLRNRDAAALDWLDTDAVNILTVHQAKGLEFEAVFCPMLIEHRFPLKARGLDIAVDDTSGRFVRYITNEEDERRLFYVAVTRAKSYLYLLWSKDIGLVRERAPSAFYESTKHLKTGSRVTVYAADSADRTPVLSTSYSQLEYYLACPYRYMLLYPVGMKTPQDPFFAFGRIVHMVLRLLHESYRNGTPLSADAAVTLFKDNVAKVKHAPRVVMLRQLKRGEAVLRAYCQERTLWLEQTASTEFPVSFGQEFTKDAKVYRFMMHGQVDLIREAKGHTVLVDFKTGKSHEYIKTDLQLQTYALALRQVYGVRASQATVYYVEEGTERVYEVTDEWLAQGEQVIQSAVKGIADLQFTPTPGDVCSRCEVKNICRHREE